VYTDRHVGHLRPVSPGHYNLLFTRIDISHIQSQTLRHN
jgi:hypothetical protein